MHKSQQSQKGDNFFHSYAIGNQQGTYNIANMCLYILAMNLGEEVFVCMCNCYT